MYDNLNTYKVFYTVAGTGSISRAADMLFISQPAISKSIKSLEDGLKCRLFIRTSKGVKLTDEGQTLYRHIQNAFDSISKGEDEIKKINELGIGKLRIGVSTSLCKHILLDYLQNYIVKYPHIKVIIDCHSTLNTIKLIQEDKIDIGLICETDIPSGYKYYKISDIHDIFVTSDVYLENLHLREQEEEQTAISPWLFSGNLTALANSISEEKVKNERKLTVKEILEKSNLMLLEKNNITRTHIDEYLSSEKINPKQILEINNMDLLIDFAAIGMGVASVVREFAEDYLKSGQITELPLEKEIPKRTVGFVFADAREKSPALSHFLDFCLKS